MKTTKPIFSRRQFLHMSALAGVGLFVPRRLNLDRAALTSATGSNATSGRVTAQVATPIPLDPTTQIPYQFTNPVPNALAPSFIFQPSNKNKLKYKVGMYQFSQWLGLKDPLTGANLNTTVWGYGDNPNTGTYPGKTFEVVRDKPITVKWENKLIDALGTPLPHLLPVDESVHWAYGHLNRMMGTAYSIAANGVPVVPHVHGGHTESDSDGLPEYWFSPGWGVVGPRWVKKDYFYANDQEAGTIWYHDHALGITRLNVYAGLAGFYIIRDGQDTGKPDNPLGLPAYPYEAALAVQDRQFDATGQLYLPSAPADVGAMFEYPPNVIAGLPNPTVAAEFFGDHILVNGMAWPKMDVEPRKYRLRLLNGSDSRFYILRFENGMPFWQIGADDGFLNQPTPLTQLILGPGERADVIVDFAGLDNQQIVLANLGPDEPFGGGTPGVDFDAADPATTGKVMRFDVILPLNTAVPDRFDPNAALRATPYAVAGMPTTVRKLALFEGEDQFGRLRPQLGIYDPTRPLDGSLLWDEAITENPALNDVEVWEVYNATADAHPIHLHLVSFEILGRRAFEGVAATVGLDPLEGGTKQVLHVVSEDPLSAERAPEENERGPKDTAQMYPGEITRVKAKFDLPGRYVWHCHILSHEDHEMMRPYNVV